MCAMAADLDAALLMVLVSLSKVDGTGLVDVVEAVVGGAEEQLGRAPTREEFEESVIRLIGLGYVCDLADEIIATESGEALAQSKRRVAPASRLQRICEAMSEAAPSGRPASWVLPRETWERAVVAGGERRGSATSDRLHIIEGLLRGLDLAEDIIRIARDSVDTDEIRRRLIAAPFGFSEIQANHVMSTAVRSFSGETRTALEQEAEQLRGEI
jgi:ParB-like chromosome segregation protein Spo0J